MSEGYWCDKCRGFVSPIRGKIEHPHLGTVDAYVCPKCLKPVSLKEDDGKLSTKG